MRLAIMQPYFLPYIGYFQLLGAADQFVLLDDVNFINRGWINRNRIFANGRASWITVPLVRPSQNRAIRDIDVQPGDQWKRKMARTVELAYARAPFFRPAQELFHSCLATRERNLSRLLYFSLKQTCDYLAIDTPIEPTSSVYERGDLRGQDRIMDICVRTNATMYVNPPGGRQIYEAEAFDARGIELTFLEPRIDELGLRHSGSEGPMLSMLDLLMWNAPEDISEALHNYALNPECVT